MDFTGELILKIKRAVPSPIVDKVCYFAYLYNNWIIAEFKVSKVLVFYDNILNCPSNVAITISTIPISLKTLEALEDQGK